MTGTENTGRAEHAERAGQGTAGPTGRGEQPDEDAARIGTLRGAQVAHVDPRRLRTLALAACVVVLAVTAVVLFLAGARRNAQVAALHDNGVRVTVSVTRCQGELGGSGFNFVGYACTGTYTRGGHRYDVSLPGNTFRPAGTNLTLVANSADPRLVTTVRTAQLSQPTATVYLVPAGLMVVAAGIGVAMTVGRRRQRSSRNRRSAPSPVLPAR